MLSLQANVLFWDIPCIGRRLGTLPRRTLVGDRCQWRAGGNLSSLPLHSPGTSTSLSQTCARSKGKEVETFIYLFWFIGHMRACWDGWCNFGHCCWGFSKLSESKLWMPLQISFCPELTWWHLVSLFLPNAPKGMFGSSWMVRPQLRSFEEKA